MAAHHRLLLIANIACLVVVALVPLSLLFGLTDVDVPASAIVGFSLVAIPAGLTILALIGLTRSTSWLASPVVLQLALLGDVALAVLATVSLYHMLADGRTDLAPFTVGMLLLFGANALALLWVAPGGTAAPPGGSA
jgi:hypothetical protein